MTRPATIDIDRMKAFDWLKNGAQPTDTVRAILRFKGILYYKHLQRGVQKGAMTPEDAETKFRAWVDDKEGRIAARVKATAEERKSRAAEISGTRKKAEKKKAADQDADELLNVNLAAQAAAETAEQAPVAEESTPAAAEETTEQEKPAAE
jgi:small subunit ribosomal protein S16